MKNVLLLLRRGRRWVGSTVVISSWILAAGTWDDSGQWDDSDVWID